MPQTRYLKIAQTNQAKAWSNSSWGGSVFSSGQTPTDLLPQVFFRRSLKSGAKKILEPPSTKEAFFDIRVNPKDKMAYIRQDGASTGSAREGFFYNLNGTQITTTTNPPVSWGVYPIVYNGVNAYIFIDTTSIRIRRLSDGTNLTTPETFPSTLLFYTGRSTSFSNMNFCVNTIAKKVYIADRNGHVVSCDYDGGNMVFENSLLPDIRNTSPNSSPGYKIGVNLKTKEVYCAWVTGATDLYILDPANMTITKTTPTSGTDINTQRMTQGGLSVGVGSVNTTDFTKGVVFHNSDLNKSMVTGTLQKYVSTSLIGMEAI